MSVTLGAALRLLCVDQVCIHVLPAACKPYCCAGHAPCAHVLLQGCRTCSAGNARAAQQHACCWQPVVTVQPINCTGETNANAQIHVDLFTAYGCNLIWCTSIQLLRKPWLNHQVLHPYANCILCLYSCMCCLAVPFVCSQWSLQYVMLYILALSSEAYACTCHAGMSRYEQGDGAVQGHSPACSCCALACMQTQSCRTAGSRCSERLFGLECVSTSKQWQVQ